jgi:hypothetical protein
LFVPRNKYFINSSENKEVRNMLDEAWKLDLNKPTEHLNMFNIYNNGETAVNK